MISDASQNSVSRIEEVKADNNRDLGKSPTDVTEEMTETTHDTKTNKLRLKGNIWSLSSFDEVPNPEATKEITAEICEICCAVCPRRFASYQDLRRHMYFHTGEIFQLPLKLYCESLL